MGLTAFLVKASSRLLAENFSLQIPGADCNTQASLPSIKFGGSNSEVAFMSEVWSESSSRFLS